MKKNITGILLAASISTSLAAASDLYVGLDLISSSSTFTTKVLGLSVDTDNTSGGYKLKFGYESESAWRFQGYFLHEIYDKKAFGYEDNALNEVGLDVIKGFEVTPEFSPFIQFGLGFGSMPILGYTEDKMSEASFKFGAGLMYKFSSTFELLGGLDIQGRRWSNIQLGTITVETSESSSKLYLGANLHF